MSNQLTYEQLLDMEGHIVRVVDRECDYHSQICEVSLSNDDAGDLWLTLSNGGYEFAYDPGGKCVDGEFEAYLVE